MFAVFILVGADSLFGLWGGIPSGLSLAALRGALQLVATTGFPELPVSEPSRLACWLHSPALDQAVSGSLLKVRSALGFRPCGTGR